MQRLSWPKTDKLLFESLVLLCTGCYAGTRKRAELLAGSLEGAELPNDNCVQVDMHSTGRGAVHVVPLVPGINLLVWYLIWYFIFRRMYGVMEFAIASLRYV